MVVGLPFYVFVGLVHSFYLVDQLVFLNRDTCSTTKLDESKQILKTCLKPTIDLTEFILLIEGEKSDPYKFMQKRCSLRPVADNCLDTATETLNDCFNSTMLQGMQVWKKIDNDVGEYVCKNDAQVALDLFEKSEVSCWNRGVSGALNACVPKLNITADLYDIQAISKHCSKTEEFDTCVKENLTKHCPDNIANIERTIIQIIKNHICNNKK